MTLLPGKFVWFEHHSRDLKRAQAFYGEVLGWKVEGQNMGDFTYEMIKTPQGTTGGYATTKGDEAPHWIAYISVEDVDATARKVTAAGGKVVAAPYDIPTVGRSAGCADPYGARFDLFCSSRGDAEDTPTRPVGHVDWNELSSPDPARSVAFYEQIFGYTHENMPMPNGDYFILSRGVARGGVMKTPVPGLPSQWIQYIVVDDTDAAIARATRSGGRLSMPALDVENIGRFAVLADPLGAPFGIIKPVAQPASK